MIESQFIYSLIAGVFISGVAGYLGSLMLSKRMVLVAGPLGHLALPGAALSLIYGFNMSLGAFPFIILGIILIWLLEVRTRLPLEALTAIVFASGVSVAFLFLPIHEAESALIGDITKVGLVETAISVILCSGVFIIIRKIYPVLTLINISEELAVSENINIKKYNLIYLLSVAIIVALGVELVGGLLTVALIAIPSSTARNLSKNLFQYSVLSGVFGMLSAILGILMFKFTGFPAGPLVAIISTLFFLISLI